MSFAKAPNEFEYAGIVWNDYTTLQNVQRAEKFQFRSSDVCVCTFPRCGTTLTQEIVWHIVNRETIKKDEKYADIDERFPFLEYNAKWGGSDAPEALDVLEAAPSDQTRLIKTHCPLSLIGQNLLPAKARVIAVTRNPKDCCVSLFKFMKGHEMFGPWAGDLEEFVDAFVAGHTFSGNFFKVVPDLWEQRKRPNFLFLKYEDLVKRPEREVKRIAEFLEMPLTPEQLDCVLHNCKFETMSKNENVNYVFDSGFTFLRKGVVGDWREHLSEQQSAKIDAASDRTLRPIGLEFEYE